MLSVQNPARLASRLRPPRSVGQRLLRLAGSRRLPRRTVRLRLTLLYGCLFLISGAGLLAITYVLVRQTTDQPFFFLKQGPVQQVQQVLPGEVTRGSGAQAGVGSATVKIHTNIPGVGPIVPTPILPTPQQAQAQANQLTAVAHRQHGAELHRLLVESGIALAIMAVVAIALGWLISGRVLRPLRTMTAATRRISEDNLHERLALRGPDDELKDLADTIDGLLARLEAAFDAQRRFIANASHELRTPLAMMRTSLDVAVAKPEPVSAEVNVLSGKLREGLDQADRLLESFLVLARAQHGGLPDQTTVSLAQIVSLAIDTRREAIAARRLELFEQIDDVRVNGSEMLLARMIENVIENAVRHNVDSGWIRVRAAVDGPVARVVVESGGQQLDEARVRELAQPFRRLRAERTGSEKGVGLGLSIVAAIATAHGGALELHARREGGLRVEIRLPAAPQPLALGSPA